MSAEPYTPDETELIGCYGGAMEEQAGENYDQAKADAVRGIAKIKADSLRDAANELSRMNTRAGVVDPTRDSRKVRAMADRIEEEA